MAGIGKPDLVGARHGLAARLRADRRGHPAPRESTARVLDRADDGAELRRSAGEDLGRHRGGLGRRGRRRRCCARPEAAVRGRWRTMRPSEPATPPRWTAISGSTRGTREPSWHWRRRGSAPPTPRMARATPANAAKLYARLDALDNMLRQKLAGVTNWRFLVYRDDYQYLERRYQLSAAGAVLGATGAAARPAPPRGPSPSDPALPRPLRLR